MPSSRRHRRRPRVWRYIITLIVALIVAAIGGGLYFGPQTEYWKQLASKLSPSIDPTSSTEPKPSTPAESEFELFLANSNVQQLILKSTELADDSHDDLLTRLDRQQNRIDIADALLAQAGNQRAQTFGNASKLKAMRTRELIEFDHGLTDEADLQELARIALQHANATDDNTKRQAMMGRLLVILIQSSLFDGSDRPESIASALAEFQAVANQNFREQEVAVELFGYLQRIHLRANPEVFQRFAEVFEASFGRSDREQVRKLAENVAAGISDAELDFVDILGESATPQSDAAERLAEQLREALERSTISQQGHVAIGRQIRNLAIVGQYQLALELADVLQRRIAANDALQPLSAKLQQDRKQYRLVGNAFSLEGIMTLAGGQFVVRHSNAPVKALIFMTAETMQQTQQAVGFIMNIAGKYIADEQFCLSLIYIDDGNNEAALSEFKKLAALVDVIDFGWIDSSSEQGKSVIERLAVVSPPMVMMLDAMNQIRGIDVNRLDFERRFKAMLDRN